MGIAEVLLISVYSESFSLGYSAPGVPSFWIWLCESWLLIEFSLNLQKAWSTKSSCSCVQHPGLLFLAFYFIQWRTTWQQLLLIPEHKKQKQHTMSMFLEIIRSFWSLSGTWYRRIRLTSRCVWLRIVSPEIINLSFLGGGVG